MTHALYPSVMTVAPAMEPSVGVAQARRLRGLISAALFVMLLIVAMILRALGVGDGTPPSVPSANPIDRSLTWLAGHDYTVIAQVRGPNTFNADAVRRGLEVRGGMQTMAGLEDRQTGYHRFRLITGQAPSAGADLGSSTWLAATSAQKRLLAGLAQPGRVLAQLGAPERLRYAGRDGDAEIYRGRHGSALYVIGNQPALVVIPGARAGEEQVYRYTLASPVD